MFKIITLKKSEKGRFLYFSATYSTRGCVIIQPVESIRAYLGTPSL